MNQYCCRPHTQHDSAGGAEPAALDYQFQGVLGVLQIIYVCRHRYHSSGRTCNTTQGRGLDLAISVNEPR